MMDKYYKQICMKEIGNVGQKQIENANITLIGVGGLGCTVLVYLVRMGVRKITLIDGDVIEMSNLSRQILYTEADIGNYKVDVAEREVMKINNQLKMTVIRENITSNNIGKLLENTDIIIDCVDNMLTRKTVADYVQKTGKLAVEGAVEGFKGWIVDLSPRFYKIFNRIVEKFDDNMLPNSGVLGSVVGTIGTLMATEAIKMVLNLPSPINHRLLYFDGKNLTLRLIAFEE